MESTPPPPKQGLLGWKIMSPELKGSCGENLKCSSSSKASSLSEVAPVKTSLSVVPLLINLCHPLLNMRSFVNCVVCLPYALPLLYISLFLQEHTSVKWTLALVFVWPVSDSMFGLCVWAHSPILWPLRQLHLLCMTSIAAVWFTVSLLHLGCWVFHWAEAW